MQYLLGAVALDTRPLSADSVRRTASGGLIAKPVIGGRQRKERTEKVRTILSSLAQRFPTRTGGLDQLEALHAMRRAGARFP